MELAEHLGSDTNLYVNVGDLGPLVIRKHGNIDVQPGDCLGLRLQRDLADLFSADGASIPHAASEAACDGKSAAGPPAPGAQHGPAM